MNIDSILLHCNNLWGGGGGGRRAVERRGLEGTNMGSMVESSSETNGDACSFCQLVTS